ncbi:MAG: NepR family anti-sigma factor [Methylovirgula sp.]
MVHFSQLIDFSTSATADGDPSLDLPISAIHTLDCKGETLTKGKTVTKPIELGLKRANPQKQPKMNKTGPCQGNVVEETAPGGDVAIIPPRSRKASAKPEIVAQIGQQLIRVYKDVVDQPVPDRFLELLQALEQGATPASATTTREAQSAGATKAPKGS